MDELLHGDSVLTVTNGQAPEYKEIFFFGHRNPSALSPFRCLHTTSHNSKLCLTNDHFVVASETGEWKDARYVRSENVKTGMTVWELESQHQQQQCVVGKECGEMWKKAVVGNVTVEWMYGLYNPYTEANAMIVVNGVVASTHSAWFLDSVMPTSLTHLLPAIYETCLTPARALYHLMGAQWASDMQQRLEPELPAQEETSILALVLPYQRVIVGEASAILSQLWTVSAARLGL